MKNPGVSKNPRKNKKTKNASFVRCFSGPIYFLDDIAHVLSVSRDFRNFIHEILYLLEVTKGQKKKSPAGIFLWKRWGPAIHGEGDRNVSLVG